MEIRQSALEAKCRGVLIQVRIEDCDFVAIEGELGSEKDRESALTDAALRGSNRNHGHVLYVLLALMTLPLEASRL
jgi:hypothetical protein